MLIRNQDRTQLLNLDNGHISIDFMDKNRVLFCGLSFSDPCDYTCIGEYSTETKAIHILDIIQDVYRGAVLCQSGFNKNVIFQMPKDEDVILSN